MPKQKKHLRPFDWRTKEGKRKLVQMQLMMLRTEMSVTTTLWLTKLEELESLLEKKHGRVQDGKAKPNSGKPKRTSPNSK